MQAPFCAKKPGGQASAVGGGGAGAGAGGAAGARYGSGVADTIWSVRELLSSAMAILAVGRSPSEPAPQSAANLVHAKRMAEKKTRPSPTDNGNRARIAAPESRYHARMLATMVLTLLVAGDPAGKLPAPTAKEMTDSILAINKALGLENWDAAGEKPCVDRGGLEGTIKDVSATDTRQCASGAIGHGFPGLGKDFVLGIPMAPIGPVTVFAIGIGEAAGWGAYSCDPKRRCGPTKLSADSKQAKRLSQRYAKACASSETIWFPNRDSVCAGVSASAPAAPPAAKSAGPAPKPTPDGTPARTPWPVKE